MGVTRTYSLSNVRMVVGNTIVSGFGREDAFSWQWSAGLWSRTTGQDGDNTYARNLERVIQARVSLLGTSRAYSLLSAIMEAQSGDSIGIVPTLLVPLPFLLVDSHTGDRISSNQMVIMTRPSPSKGQELGDAVFGLELPNPTVNYGSLNIA